jgi:hypothetical protein
MEHSPTVDSIKKQLPSQHTVTLALARWISTNKLAVMWDISNYVDDSRVLGGITLLSRRLIANSFSVSKPIHDDISMVNIVQHS